MQTRRSSTATSTPSPIAAPRLPSRLRARNGPMRFASGYFPTVRCRTPQIRRSSCDRFWTGSTMRAVEPPVGVATTSLTPRRRFATAGSVSVSFDVESEHDHIDADRKLRDERGQQDRREQIVLEDRGYEEDVA